ncbi:MAG: hypothetical protein QJR11_10445 [Fulvimonas sp.]|nr:hypothetical protein [Fulvimonas sp.]
MSTESTRPVPVTMGTDGVPVARTTLSPTSDRVRAQCKVPPPSVVPIVFVPGIMGSNLRDKGTKQNIWGLNSTIGMLFQWGFRSSKTRQSRLNPDNAEVDPNGGFPGQSATVPDEETARKRGWGTVGRMSYGDFLRWLDDALNADLCGAGEGAGKDRSPWADYEGKRDLGTQWGAERAFQPLTPEESRRAWNGFFCPVHAVGYNWLRSNGESGKYLAQKIQQIIEGWNAFEINGHKPYRCEKVILVTHSMGGLATRAAVHPKFGNAADKVLGIVHGEQPATGAAAAYHHCRSGYEGLPGIVLGRNAAQVTAVFANSPGAMELLPNQQYPKRWLKVRAAGSVMPILELPESDPYMEIYMEKDKWWRLVDPELIDPAGYYMANGVDPFYAYRNNVANVSSFHTLLNTSYHAQTYIHYGVAEDKYSVWGDLIWESTGALRSDPATLALATAERGSDPVVVQHMKFHIVEPQAMGYAQPGDGTVPACSGEAPHLQGGENIRQSFRMNQGFEHQDAYNDPQVRQATLWCIGKILQNFK